MENDEKVESSAEIISDIRERADTAERHGEHQTHNDGVAMLLRSIADRLEAALKREHSQSWHHREMEELILRHEKEVAELKRERDLAIYAYDPTKAGKSRAPDSSAYALEALKLPYYRPVGNMPAMRILWKKVIRLINVTDDGIGWDWHVAIAEQVYKLAQTALALPRRNCDVGTAEEQEERYLKLKREHVDRMARCPAVGQSFFFPDSLYWAQMPYEAQEGDAK